MAEFGGSTVAPVDLEHLDTMTDGDTEFAAELIEIYLIDTKQRLEILAEALQGQNVTLVEREAHTIKGASSNVGTNLVREVAFELETLARQGDLSKGVVLLETLNAEFAKADSFFKTYLEGI